MDGILPLWKEKGMTSHDCVFKLRKILHTKKIGHGGTLDPDVSGVLPICIGKGTKVIEYMVDSGKTYEGEITLGFSTTTEDVSGEIVEQEKLSQPFSLEEIDQAMAQMTGEITQVPPMFSAVKVNGKRLYEYARNGEEVERPQRTAMIYSFERTSQPVFDMEQGTQSWSFKVVCGKGTYVRTLSVDTGKVLGVPAHMSELVRTGSGGLNKEQCVTLAEVAEKMEQEAIKDVLLPIEVAVSGFPKFDLTDEQYSRVKNGVFLSQKELGLSEPLESLIALYYQGLVVSLYQQHPEKSGVLKPSKVLRNN
ncbi:tRNA pseudouridine(55) synthase TruB [Candidatus Enterococcus clewellii]|uniref:tRNA pseudouridine synthase B n=1 Tax=Candidatus Enterococcus clewellii TaxID=1834193 RepID=A0A242KDL5_9ENTE|nr:tRNA pseudouridine(55) synthase TruB [Enterococcus sp. 9E7_DIV0242]OTP19259.1 tRNA pseudouridine(55) synthase [Enterococcus sp. 9E7_DIV0242]OTP19261.1 tRNA pseudouridine(55) synthase [Enterococcus sp. 9E7_DIV0242]